jgi:DcmR-like sensory protein
MTSCAHLLDHASPEEHLVQLYGKDDRLLIRNISRFMAEGLRRGDGLVAIATPEHSGSVARQLRTEPGYSKAVLEGRLVFLDAQATLDRFMVAGQPDRELFDAVVGEALKGVQERAGHTGVRAYGEMVGLLWVAGQRAAAVRLEEYWNGLLRSSNISLFCAYPIDVFGEEFRVENIDALLCAHTHMVPIDDELEFALNRAMNEVLGERVAGVRALIKANHRPSWGEVPRSEAVILWLRNNLPGSASEILGLARQYYQPLAAARL